MLLNEIEILLAQARLLELYLKQAEATAEDEMARLHERHEHELTLLRTQLAAKNEISIGRESEPVIDNDARAQIESLEYQLADGRRAVESRDADLRNAKGEADYLRDRINQLETAHQQAQAAVAQAVLARQQLEAELDSVRGQLTDHQESLQEYQLVARQIQDGLQSQMGQLQDQLQSQARSAAQ